MNVVGLVVVTEPDFSRELPRTRECARLAREFLEDSIPNSPALDSLGLIASELVTNAFTHGVGDMSIALASVGSSEFRLCVINDYDLSAEEPNLSLAFTSNKLAERGRGLQIVEAMSSAWGWDILDSRLVVWANVAD